MKKVLLLILALILVMTFVLVSCGNSDETVNESTPATSQGEEEGQNNTQPASDNEQKTAIKANVGNMTLGDLMYPGKTIENAIPETITGYDVEALAKSLFTLGKRLEVSVKNNDKLEGTVVAELADNQVYLNSTSYDEDGKPEHPSTFHIVNKDGDVYFYSDNDVEQAKFVLKLSEIANLKTIVNSLEEVLTPENIMGSALENSDSAASVMAILDLVADYKFPELTDADLVKEGDFFILSQEYLLKVVNGVMDKIAAGMTKAVASAPGMDAEAVASINAAKQQVAQMLPMLNLKIGFQASAEVITGVKFAINPVADLTRGMGLIEIYVDLEYKGLQQFESLKANAKAVSGDAGSTVTSLVNVDVDKAHADLTVLAKGDEKKLVDVSFKSVFGSSYELKAFVDKTIMGGEDSVDLNADVTLKKENNAWNLDAEVKGGDRGYIKVNGKLEGTVLEGSFEFFNKDHYLTGYNSYAKRADFKIVATGKVDLKALFGAANAKLVTATYEETFENIYYYDHETDKKLNSKPADFPDDSREPQKVTIDSVNDGQGKTTVYVNREVNGQTTNRVEIAVSFKDDQAFPEKVSAQDLAKLTHEDGQESLLGSLLQTIEQGGLEDLIGGVVGGNNGKPADDYGYEFQ